MRMFVAMCVAALVLAATASAASKPGGVGAYFVARTAVGVAATPTCQKKFSDNGIPLSAYDALKKLVARGPRGATVIQVVYYTVQLLGQIAQARC